jgi:hypothetical protein
MLEIMNTAAQLAFGALHVGANPIWTSRGSAMGGIKQISFFA